MENEATAKTPIPTRSGFPLLPSVSCLLSSVSCLLSSVSCLLSPVSCLLSSVFCLLSPVFCLLSSAFCPIRPSCPACRRSTIVEGALQSGLFSQNKPNPLKAKTNATTCITKSYEDKPPRPARKNKPKQTQSPARYAIRNTRYEIRTQTTPLHSKKQTQLAFSAVMG